jgi:hypothetical protein
VIVGGLAPAPGALRNAELQWGEDNRRAGAAQVGKTGGVVLREFRTAPCIGVVRRRFPWDMKTTELNHGKPVRERQIIEAGSAKLRPKQS